MMDNFGKTTFLCDIQDNLLHVIGLADLRQTQYMQTCLKNRTESKLVSKPRLTKTILFTITQDENKF